MLKANVRHGAPECLVLASLDSLACTPLGLVCESKQLLKGLVKRVCSRGVDGTIPSSSSPIQGLSDTAQWLEDLACLYPPTSQFPMLPEFPNGGP